MPRRESAAVEKAVAHAQAHGNISEAARKFEVAISSVRRALRRRGEEPRAVPAGENHYAFGTTRKRQAT